MASVLDYARYLLICLFYGYYGFFVGYKCFFFLYVALLDYLNFIKIILLNKKKNDLRV